MRDRLPALRATHLFSFVSSSHDATLLSRVSLFLSPDLSMPIFSEELLTAAVNNEPAALAELDARGFLCGKDEDRPAYISRLRTLQKNIAVMSESLAHNGFYDIEGLKLNKADMIAPHFFREVKDCCESLYAFSIDWVPGFFIDPSFSLLFGGCAFYFYPDFFAIFIIRRSFKHKERWLIYRRQELLAHELCHVARIGLNSTIYEESLAYLTARSPFRRLLGGLFHRQQDSFLFLGVTFLLLGAQILRTQFMPSLPIWPFWSLLAAVFAWLAARHAYYGRLLKKALKTCAGLAGSNALPVIFRCCDQDIAELAAIRNTDEARNWLDKRRETSLRWQVIHSRFCSGT